MRREDRAAVSIAAALRSHHRKRVLLCDLDAQANASTWLTSKNGDPGKSIYDVIMQRAPSRLHPENAEPD